MAEEPNSRVVVISLHPEWSDAVFAGNKTVEFRRVAPVNPVSHMVIYATMPVGNVVGYFTVDRITEGSPSSLWRAYGRRGSISRRRFSKYFRSKRHGYAIEIGKLFRFDHPVSLADIGVSSPPQSFVYLKTDEFASIKASSALA